MLDDLVLNGGETWAHITVSDCAEDKKSEVLARVLHHKCKYKPILDAFIKACSPTIITTVLQEQLCSIVSSSSSPIELQAVCVWVLGQYGQGPNCQTTLLSLADGTDDSKLHSASLQALTKLGIRYPQNKPVIIQSLLALQSGKRRNASLAWLCSSPFGIAEECWLSS